MKPGKNSGFTLLEVMVATAVLAIGVVPLLVTHANTVANIRRSREMTVASLLARDRLAELEVYGFAALAGEAGFFASPLPGGPGAEPHPFLDIEEEVREVELLALLEARVEANRRFRPPGDGEDRGGARFSTYIVNLYFELEEEFDWDE